MGETVKRRISNCGAPISGEPGMLKIRKSPYSHYRGMMDNSHITHPESQRSAHMKEATYHAIFRENYSLQTLAS
jgi:hypothetical protein